MTENPHEHDEATDPDPATITDLETYDEVNEEAPGAPTAEDLAADRNLYPEATDDDVADGTALPDTEPGDAVEESSEGHPDGDV